MSYAEVLTLNITSECVCIDYTLVRMRYSLCCFYRHVSHLC